MTSGYIYCISNEFYKENVFKIGFTNRPPDARLKELFNTSVPTEFKIELCKKVNNSSAIEASLHNLLSQYRIHKSREFFLIELPKVKSIFDLIEGDYIDEYGRHGITACGEFDYSKLHMNASYSDFPYKTTFNLAHKCKKEEVNFKYIDALLKQIHKKLLGNNLPYVKIGVIENIKYATKEVEIFFMIEFQEFSSSPEKAAKLFYDDTFLGYFINYKEKWYSNNIRLDIEEIQTRQFTE